MKGFLTWSKFFFARDPPFEPKPSLKLVCDFLVGQCTRPCPQETCPVCQQKTLPEEPQVICNYYFVTKTAERANKRNQSIRMFCWSNILLDRVIYSALLMKRLSV